MTSEQAVENEGRVGWRVSQLRNLWFIWRILMRRQSIIDSLARVVEQRCVARILSFESDCLPFGTPVLVWAR
jgi:hypothetical protein